MLFENLSFGLDIATALSVIAAAIAFIWNSVNSSRREQKERQKEMARERVERQKEVVKNQVFKVIDKLIDEKINLFNEIMFIEHKVRDGETNMNLNSLRDMIYKSTFIFKSRIEPIGNVYGNGIFLELAKDYEKEMYQWTYDFAELTSGESDKEWDFNTVMFQPTEITDKYITQLLLESEKYIDNL